MSMPALVILLHGVGSSGADLTLLAGSLRQSLPHADFVAPDAPLPFDHGPGRQWFSVTGITETNRPQRIAAARAAFDRTLTAIIAAHGLEARLEQVALVGFSQGSIMALDAVASGRWKIGAAVAFSGRLASPPPLAPSYAPSLATKLLLVHGAADPVIPPAGTIRAADVLESLGMTVTRHIFPGIGHTISPDGAAMAARFLAAALPA